MPAVTFLPEGKSVIVPEGTSLIRAAQKAGISIDMSCGGEGTCRKCQAKIIKGKVKTDSQNFLDPRLIARDYILMCKSRTGSRSLTIEISEIESVNEGKFVEQTQDTHAPQPETVPKKDQLDPMLKKWCMRIKTSAGHEAKSDLDQVTRGIQKQFGSQKVTYVLDVLQELASTLRAENGLFTLLLIHESDQIQVVGIEAGDSTGGFYGLAIDLGTTTVAVHLVSLKTAEVVSTAYDYNDQIASGQDIISRINFARKPGNRQILQNQARATINRLIREVAKNKAIPSEQICNAAISGNTTMIHLLLGLNPEYIRLDPYTPTLLEVPRLPAKEIGLDIFQHTPVTISPAVGSYVGGDITAGILCTDMAKKPESINLFIDIGTNGELVLGNQDFLTTCACSAGPAFEGGGINCGMRAARGAIDKVEIDPQTGKARVQTIGNAPPLGICGSGMISLLANLFLNKWINPAGKLDRNRRCDSIRIKGRKAEYIVCPGDKKKASREITVNEQDIENIIRAKAAIYSACALMLKQVDFDFEALDHIYIGGGFGRYLAINDAITIGLIPDLSREKYVYLGNSSLAGTVMALVSKKIRNYQLELARQMTYIELNTDPAYMDQYTGSLFLPHTDIERFPTIKDRLKS
jgi:uncharacterized 2Fe-2S/4Fe-4S cluster protein (DUF4445 family)